MNEYVVQLDEKSERELPRSFAIGRVVDFDKDGSPIHYNTRARVDAIGGVKIEVFSNEHPPPHFRVKYQGSTANFRVADCELINGGGEVLRYQKNIRHWWKHNRQTLIEAWNERRPSGCPVGEFREGNSL